jgi:hypothetical protein
LHRGDTQNAIRSVSFRIRWTRHSVRVPQNRANFNSLLTCESLDEPARDINEVLNSLGIVREPSPILIAGQGTMEMTSGERIRLPAPYIGFAPESAKRFHGADSCGFVLTVENKTTFIELARGKAGLIHGVILYTAGMPSPALLRVYRLVIEALPRVPRFHWSDIDLGGFRIASAFAKAAESPLSLWSMDPSAFPDVPSRKTLSEDEKREIQRIGERCGWAETTDKVFADGRAIEQEALPLLLPHHEPT